MIWIILPAYNEEESLPHLLPELDAACRRAGVPHRLVVVNDGSVDGTAAILDGLKATLPLDVVTHQLNRGLGETERDGFEFVAARCQRDDFIVRVEGDRTHPPEYALRLVDEIAGRLRRRHYVAVSTRRRSAGCQCLSGVHQPLRQPVHGGAVQDSRRPRIFVRLPRLSRRRDPGCDRDLRQQLHPAARPWLHVDDRNDHQAAPARLPVCRDPVRASLRSQEEPEQDGRQRDHARLRDDGGAVPLAVRRLAVAVPRAARSSTCAIARQAIEAYSLSAIRRRSVSRISF